MDFLFPFVWAIFFLLFLFVRELLLCLFIRFILSTVISFILFIVISFILSIVISFILFIVISFTLHCPTPRCMTRMRGPLAALWVMQAYSPTLSLWLDSAPHS
jgi:hypothetical protein